MTHSIHRRAVTGRLVALALLCSLPVFAAAGGEDSHRAGQLRAMTQNLYVGAEILGVAAATDVCTLMAEAHEAVEQVLANDFEQRAEALARLIASERPDVLGLQEVFDVILSGLDQVPYYGEDYLALLLTALNDHGASYYVAGTRTSAPVTVPADDDGDCPFFPPEFALGAADYLGTIIDRDVILCREGVDCDASSAWNFAFNASTTPPVGDPITIERGWVSVIATVNGRSYRVLNTHLETDGNDDFRLVQFAQAFELVETLAAMQADGLPQVVVGDLNSDDETLGPVTCSFYGFCATSYQLMTLAGFTDAWLVRGGPPEAGYTCCQDEDLLNIESAHDRRIDHIWVRGSTSHYGGPQLRGVRARVLGTEQADRSVPDNLWPSDHAGVSADLVLRTPR